MMTVRSLGMAQANLTDHSTIALRVARELPRESDEALSLETVPEALLGSLETGREVRLGSRENVLAALPESLEIDLGALPEVREPAARFLLESDLTAPQSTRAAMCLTAPHADARAALSDPTDRATELAMMMAPPGA